MIKIKNNKKILKLSQNDLMCVLEIIWYK